MRTIRASEIGTYLYCNRAWWYQKQGYAMENQVDLAEGLSLHGWHGRRVLVVGLQRLLAYGMLLLALILLTAYLTGVYL